MSTIASPRDNLRRVPSSTTPTSSTRPSIDTIRSGVTSPVSNAPPQSSLAAAPTQQQQQSKKANRAALREYYNLRAAAAANAQPPTPRIIETPDSEIPVSEIDAPDFDAEAYVAKVVKENGLEELLRLYTRVLGEVRALDAEKKALVYDNYSKLITATETIRKMRANMDPLNPMATTLDPAIAQIYAQATSIRESLRASIPPPDSKEGLAREAEARRRRTKELAIEVAGMPTRMRELVEAGKTDEAKRLWVMPRRLLETWLEKGVGGEDDVKKLIKQGDEVLSREMGTK